MQNDNRKVIKVMLNQRPNSDADPVLPTKYPYTCRFTRQEHITIY